MSRVVQQAASSSRCCASSLSLLTSTPASPKLAGKDHQVLVHGFSVGGPDGLRSFGILALQCTFKRATFRDRMESTFPVELVGAVVNDARRKQPLLDDSAS